MAYKISAVTLRRIFGRYMISLSEIHKINIYVQIIFSYLFACMMACATQKMNAQVSATAETTAKIVSGLQITKEADLNFGSMFSPTSGGVTVTVDVNNQRAATDGQSSDLTITVAYN
ncbi:MAG: hypothetical protein PWQ81_888 [Bacteroidota bacterium]|nr:hypothetical protein [Bacteroidota bacterium]